MLYFYVYHPLKVVGLVSHSIAILCTIFRLVYRGWMRHLWWEDAWAAFALIADIVCLACIWLDRRITCEYLTSHSETDPWILTVAFTSVLWAARMSIIFSIIRVANYSGSKIHKQIAYFIAASFACMWAALVAQKISICEFHSCYMGKSVALSLLITDVIADISLVAAPLHLWKHVGLSRDRKILVMSAFGASLLITAITIPHSIFLFKAHNTTTLIFAHVKTALSLVICNLLVIVTFAYRVCCNETSPDQSYGVFTSIVMMQMPCTTNTGTSLAAEEGTMQMKMEDTSVLYAKERISAEG
ncbi:hypothetical protein DFH29DRAFT_795843 [Suillus ampliporus]|nr:hypothetical protein DFH29DRAFT_795843 [Suillus ampliporus]